MPNDPLVGGVALRRPAIQSPNFQTGVQGWTINIDGSAEFNNLTVRGTFLGTDYILNSSGAFFYSGTPAAGNLIISIAPAQGFDQFGNFYRSGITVGENTFGTAANLFANFLQFLNPTSTPVQVLINPSGVFVYQAPGGAAGNLIVSLARAAGTDQFGNNYPAGLNVTAGTISGTTFSGTDFNIGSNGAFFYNGAPALGNLVASVSANNVAAQTDPFGNPYQQGFFGIGVPLTLATGSDSVVTTTSYTNIGLVFPGSSFGLGVLPKGTYVFEGRVMGKPTGTIGGTHTIGVNCGSTVTSGAVSGVTYQANSTSGIDQATGHTETITSGGNTDIVVSPTHLNFQCWTDFQGLLVLAANQQISIVCKISTSGDTYTAFAESWAKFTRIL